MNRIYLDSDEYGVPHSLTLQALNLEDSQHESILCSSKYIDIFELYSELISPTRILLAKDTIN